LIVSVIIEYSATIYATSNSIQVKEEFGCSGSPASGTWLINGKTRALCRALPSDDFILILDIIGHIDLGTTT